MPRRKGQKKSQRSAKKAKNSRMRTRQGPLGGVIDKVADSVKGIGRGILPGLFKTQMVEAPSTIGIVAPRATYRMSNDAQRIADFDPDRSMRFTGNGLFWDPIMWNDIDTGAFEASEPTGVNPFSAWRGVSPLSVDPRLFEVMKTYQYYAFRLLRFTYIPETGSNGFGADTSLAFGVSQDSQEFIDLPQPNQVQMLEQNRSILTPSWTPCTLAYEHKGTKVWLVNPESEGTIDEVVQCLLGGVFSKLSPSGKAVIGKLYIEYVCDAYEPQPVAEAGDYTVALPFGVDGNGNIFGSAVMTGDIYPANYNTSIPERPSIPPVEEEMGLLSLSVPPQFSTNLPDDNIRDGVETKDGANEQAPTRLKTQPKRVRGHRRRFNPQLEIAQLRKQLLGRISVTSLAGPSLAPLPLRRSPPL